LAFKDDFAILDLRHAATEEELCIGKGNPGNVGVREDI
jgi:hypothetical protein